MRALDDGGSAANASSVFTVIFRFLDDTIQTRTTARYSHYHLLLSRMQAYWDTISFDSVDTFINFWEGHDASSF